MSLKEYSFLLLTGKLGDPSRMPLTTAQLRTLAQRIPLLQPSSDDTQLSIAHLASIGIGEPLAGRILRLLEDAPQLEAYLARAKKAGCIPVTRTNEDYPLILRKRLGLDAPGCLWLKGDPQILKKPAVSLVGSRELRNANRDFAREVGMQAAKQGYVLVSGNARGADIVAQNACLEAGGQVICVVADALCEHTERKNILFLSEEDYDEPFSALRALRRNRVIHCLGEITFAAQCTLEKGGTWDGSVRNLKNLWSPLYCFDDGSQAMQELERMGASLVEIPELFDFSRLIQHNPFFL